VGRLEVTEPVADPPPADLPTAEQLLEDLETTLSQMEAMINGRRFRAHLPQNLWEICEAAALPGWEKLKEEGRVVLTDAPPPPEITAPDSIWMAEPGVRSS
jgi:hypothetical protein